MCGGNGGEYKEKTKQKIVEIKKQKQKETEKFYELYSDEYGEVFDIDDEKFAQEKNRVKATPITKKSQKKLQADIERAKKQMEELPIYERQFYTIINGQLSDIRVIDREKTGNVELDQAKEDEFMAAMKADVMSDEAIHAAVQEEIKDSGFLTKEEIEEKYKNNPLDKLKYLEEAKERAEENQQMELFRMLYSDAYLKQVEKENIAEQKKYKKGSEKYNEFQGENGASMKVLTIEELDKVKDIQKRKKILDKAFAEARKKGISSFEEKYRRYFDKVTFAAMNIHEVVKQIGQYEDAPQDAAHQELLQRNEEFYAFVKDVYRSLQAAAVTSAEKKLIGKLNVETLWREWVEGGTFDHIGWLNQTDKMNSEQFNAHIEVYNKRVEAYRAENRVLMDPSIYGLITMGDVQRKLSDGIEY